MTQDTRASLLLRIRDADDTDAWGQFSSIYAPLIHRFALKKGLQEADAADLTQDVFRAVAQAIGKFDYNPDIGKFRSWLFRVAQFSLNRMHSKQHRYPIGTGDTQAMMDLEQVPASPEDESEWDEEYERRVFEWAADEVKQHFQSHTWDAFWGTAVEGKSAQEVGGELGMSVGAVYVSKNRVLARIKNKIQQLGDR